MAIPVFLTLCGLSVGFLVYVLSQFWREGHQPRGSSDTMVFSRPWNPNVIVVTHPISLSAHGGISVMPLQPQTPRKTSSQDADAPKVRVLQMPAVRGSKMQQRVRNIPKARSSKKVS